MSPPRTQPPAPMASTVQAIVAQPTGVVEPATAPAPAPAQSVPYADNHAAHPRWRQPAASCAGRKDA